MKALLDLLSQPWFGTLIGFIGIVAAVFFFARTRQLPRLAYQHDEVTLLGGAKAAFPSEIEIRFSGTIVSRVTASRIILWNAGRTTLLGSSIVEKDPLRVGLGGTGAIFKITVVKVRREANAICISLRGPDATAADISFDYLDPGDGIAFEVLHSGGREDLTIEGTLMGLPEGPRSYRQLEPFRRLLQPWRVWSFRNFLRVMLASGCFFVLIGLGMPWLLQGTTASQWEWDPVRATLVAPGVAYIVLSLGLLWTRRRRYPTALECWSFGDDRKRLYGQPNEAPRFGQRDDRLGAEPTTPPPPPTYPPRG